MDFCLPAAGAMMWKSSIAQQILVICTMMTLLLFLWHGFSSRSPIPTEVHRFSLSTPQQETDSEPTKPECGAETLTAALNASIAWTTGATLNERVKAVPLVDPSDVFISVRTTAKLHRSRLPLLLMTWMQAIRSPAQVYTVAGYSMQLFISWSTCRFK